MPLEIRRTVCNRDCPDACSILASLDNGKLVRLGGDPDHPVTQGFLCERTARFLKRQYAKDRLTQPLVRDGSGFRPLEWPQALDLAAKTLLKLRKESGPEAILHYHSGGSLGMLKSVVDYFFELLGPVATERGSVCSGAGITAQEMDFGVSDSNDLFDLHHAKNILLWGKNPKASNAHLLPLLRQARSRGSRIILVDPVRHESVSLAEQFIAPRPGGDFALAMAVGRSIDSAGKIAPEVGSCCDHLDGFLSLVRSHSVEEWARKADVSLEEVRSIASALLDRPCNIQVGWGMARRTQGASIVRALDALSAISGNLWLPGGGASYYFKRRSAFDTSFLKKTATRSVCERTLGRNILDALDPPIRALWVTSGNPVAMLPDSSTVARAIESREFVVVVDSFMTETAKRATLVLPTTTLLEDDDIMGAYGHHYLGASTPVVPPPEGVHTDLEIVQMLAERIDVLSGEGDGDLRPIFPSLKGTAREWKERVLREDLRDAVKVEALEKRAVLNPKAKKVLFEDRHFPTDTGRMKLLHECPEDLPEAGFPLWLFSNSHAKSQCSQWIDTPPRVLVARCHPEACKGRGDGDLAVLESEIGRLTVMIQHDRSLRRDIVVVPKGGNYDEGTCANALIPAMVTSEGEGAAYMDCRVRIVL